MIERINLLPREQARRRGGGAGSRRFAVVAAVLLALLLAWGAVEEVVRRSLAGERGALAAQLATVEAQSRQLDADLARVRSLSSERSRLQSRIATLSRLQEGERSWTELLLALSWLVPEETWLDSLQSLDPQGGGEGALGLRLQGRALSDHRVPELLGALEEAEEFQETTLVSTRRGRLRGRDVVEFDITCSIRRPTTHGGLQP